MKEESKQAFLFLLQNVVVVQAFLDLEITWAAVALLLHQYCPEASSALKDFAHPRVKAEDVEEEEYCTIIEALSLVHAHIAPSNWDSIITKITSLEDSVLHQSLVKSVPTLL